MIQINKRYQFFLFCTILRLYFRTIPTIVFFVFHLIMTIIHNTGHDKTEILLKVAFNTINQSQYPFGSKEFRNCLPCPASINRLPISSDTKADPFNTISMTVFHALGDNLSDGEIKFPAALLIIILGRPNSATHSSTAALMAIGSLTSAITGKTLNNNNKLRYLSQ